MNIGNITNVRDSYISQGWLCPRCGKINAPWMSQCNCSGKPIEITCGDYTHYPAEWSTAGAHPNHSVTLTGEISEEVKEQLRKWRKDPTADSFIDKAEEK